MEKILFISDFSFHITGGAQKSMEIIANSLNKSFDFYVLMPGPKYESSSFKSICLSEFDNFLVNKSITKMNRVVRVINRVIKELKPAIVHAHMVSGMSLLSFSSFFHKHAFKTVYTERGVPEQYSRITKFFLKHACRKFDKIVVTTHHNENQLKKYSNKSIEIIPNTPGSTFEQYDFRKRKECRTKFSIPMTKKVAMFNARMAGYKNWELSVEIIKWLSSNYDIFFIVVFGTDKSEKDYSLCASTLASIREYVSTNNLLVYYDASLDMVSDLFYSSDYFIMTSRHESFGRTAVEAMSRKNIVFGTKVDGLAEVIGSDNYLFEDLEDFKNKFGIVFEKLEKESIDYFYNRFKTNYTLEINKNSYYNLYSTLLKK